MALIQALTKEVNLLELELAQQQNQPQIAATSTYRPPIFPLIVNTPAPVVTNTEPQVAQQYELAAPAVVPDSCSLQGISALQEGAEYPTVAFSWTLQGVPTSTTGSLFAGTVQKIGTLDSSTYGSMQYLYQRQYMATFGDATCYAYFPSTNDYSGNSSPNPVTHG